MQHIVKKILILFVLILEVNAYELPKINLDTGDKAKILFFSAESILVEEKLSYIITWKTINATEVRITYLGKIALSGDMTITEDEYKMGPIILEAINTKNNSSDTKKINKNIEADRVAPVMKVKISDKVSNVDYYNGGMRPIHHRIWNPRNIH